jgi:hypothetical protein
MRYGVTGISRSIRSPRILCDKRAYGSTPQTPVALQLVSLSKVTLHHNDNARVPELSQYQCNAVLIKAHAWIRRLRRDDRRP